MVEGHLSESQQTLEKPPEGENYGKEILTCAQPKRLQEPQSGGQCPEGEGTLRVGGGPGKPAIEKDNEVSCSQCDGKAQTERPHD